MNLRGDQAIVAVAAVGVGVVIAYCIMLVVGARARLRAASARVVRGVLSVLGSGIITAVGWVFFIFGIHRSTPVQRLVAWVGVPFLMATLDRPLADVAVYGVLLAGVVMWAVVLYAALSVVNIPGRATSAPGSNRQQATS